MLRLVSALSTPFRPGDEVCMISDGQLLFGLIERSKRTEVPRSPSNSREWPVFWNAKPETDGKRKVMIKEDQLTVTDRPLYKGSRVHRAERADDQPGRCRSVTLCADLRVVGTTAILENVNISRFSHLKEFKQKSVVYQNGWLGVISEVVRNAKVRRSNGAFSTVPLNVVQPMSPFIVEPPWINENVANPARVMNRAKFEGDGVVPQLVSAASATDCQSLFVEDLEVESVTVAWRYQVDLMTPDAPNKAIKGSRLNKLKVVKEECDSDTTFQMGNLGRYFLRSSDELKSLEEYERRFVLAHLPTKLMDLKRNRPPPLSAYLKEPEKRIIPESSIVVEIIHLNGVGEIMWQDKTMESVGSTGLVVVGSNEIMAGTFIFSKRFIDQKPENAYGVILTTDISKQTVTFMLLTCDNPPSVIEQTMTLKESEVFPHPRYRFFNESNTIVVSSKSDGAVRIGNVLDTNLHGKVSVHWIDSDRDEWCWPSDCSVFSVKGFDLECIISLINDADEVKDCPSKKFLKVLEKLKSICKTWDGDDTGERADSLGSLKYVISACQNAQTEFGKPLFPSIELHNHLLQGSEINCDDPEVRLKVKTFCGDLVKEAEILYNVLHEDDKTTGRLGCGSNEPLATGASISMESVSNSESIVSLPTPMEIDDEVRTAPETPNESGIFTEHVVVDSNHPASHHYASNKFSPEHQRCFPAIINYELHILRNAEAPGLKSRTFLDRYDLYSIAIAGPIHTPYENSLYLFDAVLPPTYPRVPPKFHFLAYGSGRLNPNLYAEGKVCVSLLGTWQGKNPEEKWTRDSNLFQVVLSIQALILVNEPYHNEPGLEEENCAAGSITDSRHAYNSPLVPKICNMMLAQMERPGDPWVEDIQKFYLENVPKFVDRWNKWLEANSTSHNEAEFLAKLSEDHKPGFVIYPFSSVFVSKMKEMIVKLDAAHKRLVTKSLSSGEPKNEDRVDRGDEIIVVQESGEGSVSSTTPTET